MKKHKTSVNLVILACMLIVAACADRADLRRTASGLTTPTCASPPIGRAEEIPPAGIVLRYEQTLVLAFPTERQWGDFETWYSHEAQYGTTLTKDAMRYALVRADPNRWIFDLKEAADVAPHEALCSLLAHINGHTGGAAVMLVEEPTPTG